MKVPKKVKQIAERIAKNAQQQRKLNTELTIELENLGIDIDDSTLIECMAYLQGDCTASELYKYLEEKGNE